MTPEQKEKFAKAFKDNNLVFYFVPSGDMLSRLVSGSDIRLEQMSRWMKIALLNCEQGKGINLDPGLVMRFIDGTIDGRNAYWLKMGEIRVLGAGDMVINRINPKS